MTGDGGRAVTYRPVSYMHLIHSFTQTYAESKDVPCGLVSHHIYWHVPTAVLPAPPYFSSLSFSYWVKKKGQSRGGGQSVSITSPGECSALHFH